MHALLQQIRAQRKIKEDPEHQIKYSYCGKDITLQTDPEGGVAGVVWYAYPRVMNWIEEQYKLDSSIFQGKKVLELGAGTGLAGILLALCGANSVLTDRVEVLDLLNININLNNVQENASAKELNWGEPLDGFQQPYDLVIVCDCIYNLSFGPQLLQTMIDLSDENTKIIFAFSTRNKPEELKYFEKVKEHFTMERVEGGDEEDKLPNIFILTKTNN